MLAGESNARREMRVVFWMRAWALLEDLRLSGIPERLVEEVEWQIRLTAAKGYP